MNKNDKQLGEKAVKKYPLTKNEKLFLEHLKIRSLQSVWDFHYPHLTEQPFLEIVEGILRKLIKQIYEQKTDGREGGENV